MMSELTNIGNAIAGFNMTNKPNLKMEMYETICVDLGLLRDIANITLQDMAHELKITEQTIRNFEKGMCSNFKIVLYYYYKLTKVHGLETMDNITKQLDEYLTLEFGNVYTDYKELTHTAQSAERGSNMKILYNKGNLCIIETETEINCISYDSVVATYNKHNNTYTVMNTYIVGGQTFKMTRTSRKHQNIFKREYIPTGATMLK